MKKEPEKLSYVLLEDTRRNVGPFGPERVKHLKELFKEFFNNIIPDDTAIGLVTFDNISLKKWIKIQKSTHNKFKKMGNNSQEKSVLDIVINSCMEYKYSPEFMKYFEKISQKYV